MLTSPSSSPQPPELRGLNFNDFSDDPDEEPTKRTIFHVNSDGNTQLSDFSLSPTPKGDLPKPSGLLDFGDFGDFSDDSEKEPKRKIPHVSSEEKTFKTPDSPYVLPPKRPLPEPTIPCGKKNREYREKTRAIAKALLPTNPRKADSNKETLPKTTTTPDYLLPRFAPSPTPENTRSRSCTVRHTPALITPESPPRRTQSSSSMCIGTPPPSTGGRPAPKIDKYMSNRETTKWQHVWASVLPRRHDTPEEAIDPTTQQQKVYWSLNGTDYEVRFLANGQFHRVYTFVTRAIITLQIHTNNDASTDEKQPYALDNNHAPLSRWKTVSLNTQNIVLKILHLNGEERDYEKNKLREILGDNVIDQHCLKQNIPFVRKVTSFVPNGQVLPYQYITQPGEEDVLGWELAQRVETGEFINTLCQELLTHKNSLTLDALLIKNSPKESVHGLFQWLLDEWKEHVKYMIDTRQVAEARPYGVFSEENLAQCKDVSRHFPLGKPRVGDFRPDNIGYDRELGTFVYIDLKLEDDSEIYLKESFKHFLGDTGPLNRLRRLVVDELLGHALSFNPDPDFISEFKKNVY